MLEPGHQKLRTLILAGAAVALLLAPNVVSAFECSPTLQGACRDTTRPQKSKLNLRNGVRPDKKKMVWKWFRGEQTDLAAYGDPTTSTDYALCMYDQSASLVYQAIVPAGAHCKGKPCWKAIGDRGFAYRDGLAQHDGITKVRLYRGEEGRARIIVKGAGQYLNLADLPLGLPTAVQMQASNGECWQSFFAAEGVRRNSDTRFGGRSSQP